jgi:Fur family transcriptional regulator, ferric uptake regulator
MDQTSKLREYLQSHGYSYTKVRRLVYEAMEDKEPQTMNEITKKLPTVDRSSVYRTITLFESINIVHRLQMGWKHKFELSDLFHEHHHHLTCLNCGQITPITDSNKIEAELESIAKSHNFSPRKHQIEIQGICDQCNTSITGLKHETPGKKPRV